MDAFVAAEAVFPGHAGEGPVAVHCQVGLGELVDRDEEVVEVGADVGEGEGGRGRVVEGGGDVEAFGGFGAEGARLHVVAGEDAEEGV